MQERLSLTQTREYLEGEFLKSAAEFGVHSLAKFQIGQHNLELISGGKRIEDPRLHTVVSGIEFENPVMAGAGWDKKGRAVDGLYMLGFSGTEVGSVLVHPQKGNPRPRLFTDKSGSVGLNSFGFNSDGQEKVVKNLDKQKKLGVVGVSLGKNKLTPDEHAPWAYAEAAKALSGRAKYYAVNLSSPNTERLRELFKRPALTDIIQATKEAAGVTPVELKTMVDLPLGILDETIEVCLQYGIGLIDSNTTVDEAIKRTYGWQGKPGGVSGNDSLFRARATERMKYITRATRGTGIQRIGVGGINDAESALERIKAGAQIVQAVTSIRETWGKVARNINLGLLEIMERDGVSNISEYIGVEAGDSF